ncbi:glucosaminidase domain-containing protein [Companilactobacillus zhongbaensis]|uniref:glucosaminidase domain-containing protein n=1 Tax=Companilactobacillus zhongbaensis TaxID=2486009 RepID=UPI000F766522|nr:glucosaminidase domain-containing protein [Companilactobacillus zhongbaensis]
MTISRRERKIEENKLYRQNSRKQANANLKKNMTILGAGLFFSGVTAQATTALTEHRVFADTYANDTNDQTTDTTTTTNTGVGMLTPRGVGDQSFIQYIGNSAQKLAGNNDLYASVMIAQAMIESGWGTSGLASAPNYNLFGIKGAYKGTAVNMPTQEDDGSGNLYSIQSDFKKYPSYKESLEDYVSLIRGGVSGNPQMYARTWKSNTSSYKDATAFLTGKYATDTTYADKLNNIIEKYNLTRFDEADSDEQNETYVFAQGDTLQSVADKFNITLETLMRLNNLKTSSYVYPGKTLIVNQVITPAGTTDSDTEANSDPVLVNTSNVVDDNVEATSNNNVYGDQQAPIIVQDETNGVTVYDPSQATDQVAVNISSNDTNVAPTNNTSADQTNDVQSSVPDQNVAATQAATSNNDDTANTQSASVPESITVKAGDTLDSLARQYNTTVDHLKQINNLDSNLLVVGQQLKL